MELHKKLPDDWGVLQELLDHPPQISQGDLAEYMRRADALRLAQYDLEAVASQITEMLVMDSPVESGQYTARLERGKLVIEIVEPPPDDEEG